MPVTERTPQQLVLESSSTKLVLSKTAGTVTLQRKLLFWKLKPSQASLSDIADVTIHAEVDRASGVDVCSTILVMRSGAGWAFPCSDKKDAQEHADAIREFLGLGAPTP